MAKQPIRVLYSCECEGFTSVLVYPIIPAKISGPPELCYEADGGEYEPDCCEHCGDQIPADTVH